MLKTPWLAAPTSHASLKSYSRKGAPDDRDWRIATPGFGRLQRMRRQLCQRKDAAVVDVLFLDREPEAGSNAMRDINESGSSAQMLSCGEQSQRWQNSSTVQLKLPQPQFPHPINLARSKHLLSYALNLRLGGTIDLSI